MRRSLKTSLAVWGILVGVCAIVASPWLRHALDRGRDEVTLERLLSGGTLASRNLVVRGGRLDSGRAVGDAHSTFVPLVPIHAAPDAEVKLVVELTRSDADARCGTDSEIHAVLRDIFWEGLSSDERKAFESSRVALAADARLLDAGPSIDLLAFGFFVGFVLLLGGIFFLVDWIKARRARRYEID